MLSVVFVALLPMQFVERFDGPDLPAGWVVVNNSQPPGEFSWHVGSPTYFAPFDGGFAACWPGAAASNTAPVSAWLISPVVTWRRGTTVEFWTRSAGPFPDRLEVRLSLAGESLDVGGGPFTTGDFSTLAVDINPGLDPLGYPLEWTRYSFEVAGVAEPVKGRLAFRYCMNDTVLFGSYVGVDSVAVADPVRKLGDMGSWPGGRRR